MLGMPLRKRSVKGAVAGAMLLVEKSEGGDALVEEEGFLSCRGGDRLNQLRKSNRLGKHEPVKSLKNLLERLATS